MDDAVINHKIFDIHQVIEALKTIQVHSADFGEIIATPADLATPEASAVWMRKYLSNGNSHYTCGLNVQRLIQAIFLNLDGVIINSSTGSIIPSAARALAASGYILENVAGGNTKLLVSIVTPIGKLVIYEHVVGLEIISKYLTHVEVMRELVNLRKVTLKQKFMAICNILMA